MRRNSTSTYNYSYYRPYSTRQSQTIKTDWRTVLLWLYGKRWLLTLKPIQLLLVIGFLGLVVQIGWSKHVAAQVAAQKQAEHAALIVAQKKSDIFTNKVEVLMTENPRITMSVSVSTAQLGMQTVGSHEVFDAASTAKLLTAITYLNMVEARKTSLSDSVGGLQAGSLLQSMITKSDDRAWNAFNDYIGHPALVAKATELGITDYDAENNSLSSRDTALLLTKLVKGSLLNEEHQQLLLRSMAKANFRDYIVPAVTSPNLVYHKVGVNQDNVHDAAIIKQGDKWLVLVIYTNGNGEYNWSERAQLMQQITVAAQEAYL